jgi:hypothetical protein
MRESLNWIVFGKKVNTTVNLSMMMRKKYGSRRWGREPVI